MIRFLCISFTLSWFTFSTSASHPSIIIIGAGPAGIAAASKLLQNSIKSIKILEAENRIGGRINSIEFGDAIVDVGAEFCHGEKGNIVYELVKDLNVLSNNTKFEDMVPFYSNGSILDPTIVNEILYIMTEYMTSNKLSCMTNTSSMGEYILKEYNSTVLEKYREDPQKLKILIEAIKLIEAYVISSEGSFNWFKPSAHGHYEESEGNQALTWSGRGYKTILEVLMKSYPDPKQKLPIDENILLNKTVSKIVWNHTEGVLVHVSDDYIYTADHVIFTPSIGVLKTNNFFVPSLPGSKTKALEALGFDGVLKIIFHFDKKWWEGKGSFSFLWSEEDLKISKEAFPDGPTHENGHSWISDINYVLQAPNNTNVLIAWVTGDLIPSIEKLPLETVKKGVKFVFDKFLGRKYNISNIDDIVVSQWCTNPHFLGTYSFEKTGYYDEDVSYQEILSKPLVVNDKPVVLFAGEATNPIHFSTVHGAIETGHREADRIIDLYKK